MKCENSLNGPKSLRFVEDTFWRDLRFASIIKCHRIHGNPAHYRGVLYFGSWFLYASNSTSWHFNNLIVQSVNSSYRR